MKWANSIFFPSQAHFLCLLFHLSFSDIDKLVLHVREICFQIHTVYLLWWLFKFPPSIYFKSQMFWSHVCMTISNSDHTTLFDFIKLLILCRENNASKWVSNNDICLSHHGSIISSSFFFHDNLVDLFNRRISQQNKEAIILEFI